MQTEYGTITTSTTENMSINEDNCLESSNTESTSDSIIELTFIPSGESQEMLLKILQVITFERNYEVIKNQNIDQRVYPTKCNKKVANGVIKLIVFLDSNTIKGIGEPPHVDINALLYTSAVTAIEHLDDLRKNLKKRSRKTPPLNNIESKITALRRKFGQLTTPINCKNTGNFTNHQKEIKDKFYNKYGNTSLQTLQFKLNLLKQDLNATSIKLKWLKKKNTQSKPLLSLIENSYVTRN